MFLSIVLYVILVGVLSKIEQKHSITEEKVFPFDKIEDLTRPKTKDSVCKNFGEQSVHMWQHILFVQ